MWALLLLVLSTLITSSWVLKIVLMWKRVKSSEVEDFSSHTRKKLQHLDVSFSFCFTDLEYKCSWATLGVHSSSKSTQWICSNLLKVHPLCPGAAFQPWSCWWLANTNCRLYHCEGNGLLLEIEIRWFGLKEENVDIRHFYFSPSRSSY